MPPDAGSVGRCGDLLQAFLDLVLAEVALPGGQAARTWSAPNVFETAISVTSAGRGRRGAPPRRCGRGLPRRLAAMVGATSTRRVT